MFLPLLEFAPPFCHNAASFYHSCRNLQYQDFWDRIAPCRSPPSFLPSWASRSSRRCPALRACEPIRAVPTPSCLPVAPERQSRSRVRIAGSGWAESCSCHQRRPLPNTPLRCAVSYIAMALAGGTASMSALQVLRMNPPPDAAASIVFFTTCSTLLGGPHRRWRAGADDGVKPARKGETS